MKIFAVDSDRQALEQIESSLKTVFTDSEILTFNDALNFFKYYSNHKADAALIITSLTLRPFDGLKLSELIYQTSFPGCIIYTTRTDSSEIDELIHINGGNYHITKPVTPAKLRQIAVYEQELCLNELDELISDECTGCIYSWCKNRIPEMNTDFR